MNADTIAEGRSGVPAAISVDGKVVLLQPDEIEDEETVED